MSIEDDLQKIIEEELLKRSYELADQIDQMCARSAFDEQQRGVLVEHFDTLTHRVSLSAEVPWGDVRFRHA